jgi:hypothetical protein
VLPRDFRVPDVGRSPGGPPRSWRLRSAQIPPDPEIPPSEIGASSAVLECESGAPAPLTQTPNLGLTVVLVFSQ